MADMREAVFAHVRARHGVEPAWLWPRHPDCAALRHADGRWFGVVLKVRRTAVGLEGDGEIDLLNVKRDPDSPVSPEGLVFLPAWHMNRRHWGGVPLDGSESPDRVLAALDRSHLLTSGGGTRRRRGALRPPHPPR